MRHRDWWLAALTVVLTPVIANASDTIHRSDLRQSIIGAYLARHVGAGDLQPMPEIFESLNQVSANIDNQILQRVLQLVYLGRKGPPDTIVNEAVAVDWGYECPTYKQLPLRMEGCRKAYVPAYNWKNAKDVSKIQHAAEAIGLSCDAPVEQSLDCSFKANVATRPIEIFNLFMADIIYSIVADMHFNSKTGVKFTVTETRLSP